MTTALIVAIVFAILGAEIAVFRSSHRWARVANASRILLGAMVTMAQCPEPSLDEMVNDPIVRALMASDGVDRGDLQRLLRSVALTLRARRVETDKK